MKLNKLLDTKMLTAILNPILNRSLVAFALLVAASQAYAQPINLCTGYVTKLMPDGVQVTMWGYGLDTGALVDPQCSAATVPGPELVVPVGDALLTVSLRNTLPDSVSITIPGLATSTPVAPVFTGVGTANQRVRSFTHETAAQAPGTTGVTGVYGFVVKPGTYLYQSGTHIAKQIQMGLYGAAIQNNSAAVAGPPAVKATAYNGVSFDRSVTMLYSEIDPTLHAAVADQTYGTTAYSSTINFKPRYFMVNGTVYQQGVAATPAIYGGTPSSTILFRFLNAGLQTHVPMINGGHLSLVAEYGNAYPFPRKQYSVLLPAGQTRDAVMTAPTVASDFAIFDRRLRLTNNKMAGIGGMFSKIVIAAVNPNAVNSANASDSAVNVGGCTLQSNARFDPLMPLLMLLALIYFIRTYLSRKVK